MWKEGIYGLSGSGWEAAPSGAGGGALFWALPPFSFVDDDDVISCLGREGGRESVDFFQSDGFLVGQRPARGICHVLTRSRVAGKGERNPFVGGFAAALAKVLAYLIY